MLHNVKDLEGYAVGAMDGEVGTVTDLYFDDHYWVIRYLVVATGVWLGGRKVLISPSAIRDIAWQHDIIDVWLTRQQVRGSPRVDTDKPVSRQHEVDYCDHYGYPYYWAGAHLWGQLMYPSLLPVRSATSTSTPDAMRRAEFPCKADRPFPRKHAKADLHLRSVNAVVGHEAIASDGPTGSVHTFVFNDENWNIRSLIVDTGRWLPGKRVVLSLQHIERISWPEREVYLNVMRQEVNASPEYVDHAVATDRMLE
jgi:hypothetical protein